MRSLAVAVTFLISVSSAAFAQSALVNTQSTPTPEMAAEQAAPAAKSSEPDMKVITGSGGKVYNAAITDAPLLSDFVLGKDTAPVVIVEYASLTCPHCAHFSNAVLPEIEKKYIDTGKVRYILRQFPLNEAALKGAMLLDCVGAQDEKKYYTFARVLFDAQSKWAFDANYMSGLETIASVGGLSKDQFQNCMNNTDRETRILRAKKDAMDDLKIPHTPYIYVGDEVYDGNRSPEALGAFIDAKLAQKKNRSWLPKW